MNLTIPELYSFKKQLLLCLLTVGVLLPSMAQKAFSQIAEEPSASSHKGILLNAIEGEIDLTKGHWTSSLHEGNSCIKFRGDGSDTWNVSKCFLLGTFKQESENIAILNREAGTLILTGDLDFKNGIGRYSFTPNERLQKYLVKENISEAEDNFMLPLFLGNLEIAFLDFLIEHYGDITAEEITQLALHEVSLANFQEYLSLYRKYGNGDPTLEEVITTKVNGIDLQYVSELQEAGYLDLNLEQMMEAKAHGINLATVEGFAEAEFQDIPMEKLLETKLKGLTTNTAIRLQQISDENISLEAVLQLQMQGVNEAFIKDLEAAGLGGLNLQQVIKAKMHELEPEIVSAIREAGFKNNGFEELLLARVHGIDTSFVNSFKNAEIKADDFEEFISAKHHEVEFSSVEDWRELGFEEIELSELLEMKIHGVKIEQVEALKEEGIEVSSIKELVSARRHDVDLEYIKQHRSQLEKEDQEEKETPRNDNLEEGNSKATYLHEFIAIKLEQDAERFRELQKLKEEAEEDSVEALEREMFEISLPKTEEQ